LRNLRASTNPDKAYSKSILGSIRVPSGKFKHDYRKYSNNNELSFSLGKDGIAASAESNVIFSQNSFLPRSADLNLTANVFGHSFNLLEVGLRAENLEHILEAYFGPKGYFKTRTSDEVFTTSNQTVNNLAQKIKYVCIYKLSFLIIIVFILLSGTELPSLFATGGLLTAQAWTK